MVLIGVDFGTTYCCMAYHNNGVTEVIADHAGNKLIPTCISFAGGNVSFGKYALYYMEYSSFNTITNIKRLIARNSTNIDLTYPTQLDKNGQLNILIKENIDDKNEDARVYKPVTIVSMILKYLKEVAENYLSLSVTGIVLTAPAYFDELQKRQLRDAGVLAGIDVREIISEPTAAALCYKTEDKKNVLVYDIGGGTSDITILVCQGVNYSPISKIGDPELGGVNFTSILRDFLVREFISKNNKYSDLRDNPIKMSKLWVQAEEIKMQLSEKTALNITINNVYKKKSLEIKNFSRVKYEALCKPLFEKCDICLTKVLQSITPQTIIDDVIFIGGSSRMPRIRENAINIISARQNGVMPTIHNNINPDEAVAIGASKQAYALSNPLDLNKINLNEITSENIGIQVGSDSMDVIFEKNTKIPCSKTVKYGTYYDGQVKIRIKMYQGDDPKIKFNKLIGILEIPNLPPRPKGEVKVLLTVQLLNNGLMKLNAYEENANSKHHEIELNNLLEAKQEIKSTHSNFELLKKIKRLIINKNVTDHKYIEFVSEMDKSDITVVESSRFNDILAELLSL